MKKRLKVLILMIFVLPVLFGNFSNNVYAARKNIYLDSLTTIKYDDKYHTPTVDIFKHNKKAIVYYDLSKVNNSKYKNDMINAVNQMDNVLKTTAGYLRLTTVKPKTGNIYTIPVTFEYDSKKCRGDLTNVMACANSTMLVFNTKFFTKGQYQDRIKTSILHESFHVFGIDEHLSVNTKGTMFTKYVYSNKSFNLVKQYPKDVELLKYIGNRSSRTISYNKAKTFRTITYRLYSNKGINTIRTESKVKGKWIKRSITSRSYRHYYNNKLNTISKNNYYNNGRLANKSKVYYNANNKHYKQVQFHYKNNGKINYRLEYIYNNQSQLKSNKYGNANRYKTFYNKNGKFTKTVNQKYTAGGKLNKAVKVGKRTYY